MNEIQNSVDQPNDYSRIMVGVDGSEGSVKALRHAIGLAQKFGSTVEAICVWSFPVAYSPLPVAWHPDEDAQRIVSTVGDTVFGSTWPSWFNATIREGSPADILIAESSSANLMVVGSRGFGGFAGLLLGSVSQQLAAHSPAPVAIIPERREP